MAPFIPGVLNTLSRLEIAACLWEAVLHLRDHPQPDPEALGCALAIRNAGDTLGTSALRLRVINWTDAVEEAWERSDAAYPLCNWHFVQQWILQAIDWSDPCHPGMRDTPHGSVHPLSGLGQAQDFARTSSHRDHLRLLARVRKFLEAQVDLTGGEREALIEDIVRAERHFAASPLPWPLDLHAAVIEHRHGVNIHVALDATTLDAEIARFCREWWGEAGDARDANTLTNAEIVAGYFKQHPSESCTRDRIRLEPPPLAPLDDGSIEEGRYCVLSTAHLTLHTADCLDKWASWPPTERPIDIAASVYGWFVPTRALPAERSACLPVDLLRLMIFGRERGFRFILLDCDADADGGLPVHGW